ncbi:hypothetical protein PENTCL1PPCAC_1320, partial [Pristionchus entomophagus]
IPRNPLRLLRAKEVTTKHCLMTFQTPALLPTLDRVTNLTKTFERGIYAPLTATGDIIINDVFSSCHCSLAFKTLQQSVFSVYHFLSFLLPERDDLPLGLTYLASALELFIPSKAIFL